MSNGPTIYARLMDRHLDTSLTEIRPLVENRLASVAGNLANEFSEMLRQAYIAGVADGFAQGVAKEAGDEG